MTLEQAMAKLDGMRTRKGSSKSVGSEKRLTFSKSSINESPFINTDHSKGAATLKFDKSFIKILAVVIILGALIFIYLWKNAAMSENSYRKGFKDGNEIFLFTIITAKIKSKNTT